MNLKFNFLFMKTITMLQFRRDSRSVIHSLRRGERLALTYRGRPLARLEPFRLENRRISEDPFFEIHHAARPSPRGPLSHDQIDAEIYERA